MKLAIFEEKGDEYWRSLMRGKLLMIEKYLTLPHHRYMWKPNSQVANQRVCEHV